MVKVSVNLGSNRPGGVDIALRGLADQTFEEFEIIFVDGRYRERHEKVLNYAKALGIRQPLYHVPNHRYNWQGRISEYPKWGNPCAGFNTGFMLSEGEIVIMLLDYAYAPPGWIESHLSLHDQRRLVMAPHLYTEMPKVFTKDGKDPINFSAGSPEATVENIMRQSDNFEEMSIFESAFDQSWLKNLKVHQWPNQDPKSILSTGPNAYSYMHTKNDSFPLQSALDVGGMDENFDRGRGPGDTEFGFRLYRAGCQTYICQEARVYCLNPRGILPNLNILIPESGAHRESLASVIPGGRWTYEEGKMYMDSRKDFATSNNPYDIMERRKEIWGWRELSQEREARIPFNEVPDEVWFRS